MGRSCRINGMWSKKSVLTTLMISCLWLSACGSQLIRNTVPAPTLLPHTTRQMQMPGFWINLLPAPDLPILDKKGIEKLNRHIELTLKGSMDIMDEKSLQTGSALKSKLKKTLLKLKPFFNSSGEALSQKFMDKMAAQINIPAIKDKLSTRYGVVTSFSNQRVLPTDDPVYSKPGNIDFDTLQNSALDLGTPVRILHETRDHKWFYVQSELNEGWVRADFIAKCEKKEALVWYRPERFVVITRAKADIFRNTELTNYHETVRMGVSLPCLDYKGETAEVYIPVANSHGDLILKTGYLRTSAINKGFLPATSRNIVQQAFEMLNAPYGWGGMYGEQDCSRFIQEILATVGIRMPRNSLHQARVGEKIGEFSRSTDTLSRYKTLSLHARGGATLLYLKGHIMLYLGQVNDRHYAIHSTYAYGIPFKTMDQIIRVNRVAVSDLSLGLGSKKGSLAERLVSVRKLSPNF